MRRLGIVFAGLLLAAVGLLMPGQSIGVVPLGHGAARHLLYVSPNGSDSGTCTKHAPCRSFARAFKLASGGAVVQVAAGDYTSSCATVTGSKTKEVTFVGTRSARVFCDLAFDHARNAAVTGLKLYQIAIQASSHLHFRNLLVTCADRAPYRLYPPADLCDATISLEDSSHLSFRRVVIGPTYDSSACGGAQTNFASAVEDVTFTSVTFRNARWQDAPCGGPGGSGVQHSENLYFSGLQTPARDITFDSCRFTNGAGSGRVDGGGADGSGPNSASLFLTGAFDHLIVRNCVFDGTGGPSIDGADDADVTNSLIENNTWTNAAVFQYTSYPSLRFVNNLGAQQGCPISSDVGSSGGSFGHNLWYYQGTGGSANRCGSTDITVSGRRAESKIFVGPAAGNLHLRRASPAIGHADPAMYPARDHSGVRRPQGRRPDIGAYEFKVKHPAKGKSAGGG